MAPRRVDVGLGRGRPALEPLGGRVAGLRLAALRPREVARQVGAELDAGRVERGEHLAAVVHRVQGLAQPLDEAEPLDGGVFLSEPGVELHAATRRLAGPGGTVKRGCLLAERREALLAGFLVHHRDEIVDAGQLLAVDVEGRRGGDARAGSPRRSARRGRPSPCGSSRQPCERRRVEPGLAGQPDDVRGLGVRAARSRRPCRGRPRTCPGRGRRRRRGPGCRSRDGWRGAASRCTRCRGGSS